MLRNAISYKAGNGLFLVKGLVAHEKAEAKPAEPPPTNWFWVVDCSGSMWGQIEKVADHLKKKLPKMVGPKDTVTLAWFSGRGQCGIILEAEPVATLTDLNNVNKAIDRWLRPQGLTGFKEPLELIAKTAAKVSKPGMANALGFMSDGCDNQWSRAEVLKAMEAASVNFQSIVVVEYGYYADRNLLSSMAEKAGGSLLFAEDFDRWQPQLEAVFNRKPTGAPRIEVGVPGDPIKGFVFTVNGDELITYAVEGDKVKIPKDTNEFFYLSPSVIGTLESNLTDVAKQNTPSPALTAAYAAVSLFAVRMESNIVLDLLKSLGDVQYIEQFSGCFGKQKYSEFMEATKGAAFDPKLRLLKGYDPNRVPREDSFTVLELLQVLASDDDNRVLMEHPKFKYSRIGRGRINADSVLTAEEQAEVEKLTQEMTATRDATKLTELSAKIAAISANKKPPLKFVAKEAPDGYPVNALVYNEKRPNISLQVTKPGTVDISSRITDKERGVVPEIFPTQQIKSYTIVKDGLVNVEVLPVNIGTDTLLKLDQAIVDGKAPKELITTDPDGTILLNVKCLPVINRQMIKAASAKSLFALEWELTKAGAAQKVYKEYRDRLVGKESSKGFKSTYSEEIVAWLNELGFSDNGFNPRGVQAESTDVYMGKEMKVSIKSFSSLPKVADVRTKIATAEKAKTDPKTKAPKFTPSETLMLPYVDECEAFLASDAYLKAADQGKAADEFFTKAARKSIQENRKLISQKANLLFSVVVGQVWFTEFASLDENTLDLKLDGQDLHCTVEMKEIEIKI